MKKTALLIVTLFVAVNGNAGLITHTDYSSGGTISAAGQNANENAIFNEFNGNIESANIKDGTIVAADIAGATITGAKIAAGTITDSLMTANTLSNASISSGTINGSTANSSATQGTIHQGTISTPDLRANAVSVAVSSVATVGAVLGSFGTTLLNTSITTVGGNVLVMGNVVFRCTSGSPLAGAEVDNGTSLLAWCQSEPPVAITGVYVASCGMSVIDTPVAGTYTYSLKWTNTANCAVTSQPANLVAIELRK